MTVSNKIVGKNGRRWRGEQWCQRRMVAGEGRERQMWWYGALGLWEVVRGGIE